MGRRKKGKEKRNEVKKVATMITSKTEWIQSKEDVQSVDLQGREITLKGVPALKDSKTGAVRVQLEDVSKAEQEFLAREKGIDPLDVHPLLLLYASSKFFEAGYINQAFRFYKMLFSLWKELEKKSYGDSYIYDEFKCARAGPVPAHLKERLVDLEKKGVVEVKWSKSPGKSTECKLTGRGFDIAKSLWDNTPDDVKMTVLKVKEDLFLVDATQIKEKIHKLYPEYKKCYTEVDTE